MSQRIGSVCTGIGGLDLAVEQATGGRTVWQMDAARYPMEVCARRFQSATQYLDDMRRADPRSLPAIDIFVGGFPCQDLSVAGKQAGLDGKRSGLYSEMLRFGSILLPDLMVWENVPALLGYRERIERDLDGIGYGSTWVQIAAANVGAPHLRRRVFLVAERGGRHRGVVAAGPPPAPVPGVRWWPTPAASNPNDGEHPIGWNARRLELMARHGNGNGAGTPLGVAANAAAMGLPLDVDRWATPSATDHKGSCTPGQRRGQLTEQTETSPAGRIGKLNPDWVEPLMGFPVGWTNLDAGPWTVEQWPALRGEPQHLWEPTRIVGLDTKIPDRPSRLKALGNAVCPQQGVEGVRLGLAGPAQRSLFGEAA